MPKLGLFNIEAKQVGEIQLNDNIFAAEVNDRRNAPSSCCIIS